MNETTDTTLSPEDIALIEAHAFLVTDKFHGCLARDAVRQLGADAGKLPGVRMVLDEIKRWRRETPIEGAV